MGNKKIAAKNCLKIQLAQYWPHCPIYLEIKDKAKYEIDLFAIGTRLGQSGFITGSLARAHTLKMLFALMLANSSVKSSSVTK